MDERKNQWKEASRNEKADEDEYLPEDDECRDDETTLEEEERLENQGEIVDELAALQQEQDLSIADLLKLYGCDSNDPVELNTQISSSTTDLSSDVNNSSIEKGEESRAHSSTDSIVSPGYNDLNLLTGSPSKLDVFDENDEDFEPEQSDYWHKLTRVGSAYQAEISDRFPDNTAQVDNSKLVFDPGQLEEGLIVDYLMNFRSRVDSRHEASPRTDQHCFPDDEIALLHLHNNRYDTQVAFKSINVAVYEKQSMLDLPTCGWSAAELDIFEHGLKKYGKNFHAIKRHLEHKGVKDIVKLYYYWKFSPMYTRFAAALDQDYTNYLQSMAKIRQVAGALSKAQHAPHSLSESSNDRSNLNIIDQSERVPSSAIGQSATSFSDDSASPSSTDQWRLDGLLGPASPAPTYRVVCRNGRLKIRWLSYHHLPPHSIEESDTHRHEPAADDADWSTNGGEAYFERKQPIGDRCVAEFGQSQEPSEYPAAIDLGAYRAHAAVFDVSCEEAAKRPCSSLSRQNLVEKVVYCTKI